MVHYSLLFGIDCYFVVFIYYFSKCRPFAEVGCGVRLTAVQMPITRESQVWDFFGFRSRRCGKSRSRVLVDFAIVSCSLDDQYVQYSAKRGLQCGLRTPQLFGLGKGV